MGKCDSVANLEKNLQQGAERILPHIYGIFLLEFLQNMLQCAAMHQFHGKIRRAGFAGADFMNGNNVRVLQRSGDPGFIQEAFVTLFRGFFRDRHGDFTAGVDIIRLDDHFHSARPQNIVRAIFFRSGKEIFLTGYFLCHRLCSASLPITPLMILSLP